MGQDKRYVRLRDKGTIFHDPSVREAITGTKIVEAEPTKRLLAAIKSGLLIPYTKEDYIKQQEAMEAKVPTVNAPSIEDFQKTNPDYAPPTGAPDPANESLGSEGLDDKGDDDQGAGDDNQGDQGDDSQLGTEPKKPTAQELARQMLNKKEEPKADKTAKAGKK